MYKIIVYGLNYSGVFLENLIASENQIIGYSDSFARISSFNGRKFYCLEELASADFDYIITVVQDRNTHEAIAGNLVNTYGVDKNKVVNIHALLADTKLHKVMDCNKNKLDGIVLGISHAMMGINPRLLEGNWKNLSSGSEDLYYHYKVLQRCVEEYPEALSDLSSIIIDMYDYTSFNYDLSQSKQICRYWSHGGIWDDIHNFNKNIIFRCSQDEAMKEEGYFLPDKNMQLLAERLFDSVLLQNRLPEFYAYHPVDYQGNNDYPLISQFNNVLPENVEIGPGIHFMGGEDIRIQ